MPAKIKRDVFNTLNQINVNEHVETKNGLNYLSWAWAWAEVKKLYPQSYYTVYENEKGWNYFTDGNTCWVKTGVTVVDEDYQQELIECLPVMDFKNKSIPLSAVTSTDINKTIQRSLTKAIARHGLGLYIYAGEDLPEETDEVKQQKAQQAQQLTQLVKSIDEKISAMTATMDTTAKKKFAEQVIIPLIGQVNYRTCKEAEKLQALLNKLSEPKAA